MVASCGVEDVGCAERTEALHEAPSAMTDYLRAYTNFKIAMILHSAAAINIGSNCTIHTSFSESGAHIG